jgi:hypothetical protein
MQYSIQSQVLLQIRWQALDFPTKALAMQAGPNWEKPWIEPRCHSCLGRGQKQQKQLNLQRPCRTAQDRTRHGDVDERIGGQWKGRLLGLAHHGLMSPETGPPMPIGLDP